MKVRYFNIDENDGDEYVWSVIDGKTLMSYNIKSQKLQKIKFEDDHNFDQNFVEEGSTWINDKNGLFIVTGNKSNLCYHYNNTTNRMTQLPSLKYSHTSGGLAIHSKSSSLICLSGSKCKTVEKYTDELLIKGYGKKKSKGDTSEMQWNNLPELSYDRANAGYVVVNDYLYAFFGYSASSNKSLHSIERLDLSKDYIGSYFEWDIIKYNRGDGVSMNLQGFICVDSKDENEIIIVGGQAGSLYNDKIISFNNTSKNLVVKGKFDIRNASFTQMKNTVPSNDAKTYFLVDDDNDLIKYDSSSNQFNIV